eukprot:scaffold166031_cov18-Prasinocladus_malaysianus.AAC.1
MSIRWTWSWKERLFGSIAWTYMLRLSDPRTNLVMLIHAALLMWSSGRALTATGAVPFCGCQGRLAQASD